MYGTLIIFERLKGEKSGAAMGIPIFLQFF